MAELKTKPSDKSVTAFLDALSDEKKKQDSYALIDLMKKVTGEEPVMWGDAIVGFGSRHYVYESGREGDWAPVGFSPRKQNLSLYLTCDFDTNQELLDRLGKHKTSKACLYIKRLSDVDLDVLEELISKSVV